MLVDSGATHNFAPARLIQAMHLPVMSIQTAEVTLPNGVKLASNMACKIHVELGRGVVRRLAFAVVDVELPFVLGMQFLRCNNAHIDFGSGTIQLRDKQGKVET